MPIPAVTLQENNPNAVLDSTLGRAYPLPVPVEVARLPHKVVAYLNVRRSQRYRAGNGQTFCNIYACDFTRLMGAYLPRVWWMPDALENFQKGETVKPVYGKTVAEMNANSLFDWLNRWGLSYGWEKADFTTVQTHVNNGAVGVLAAARKDPSKPGHIAVIVPESQQHGTAAWEPKADPPRCIAPIQCQAGAVNREYWHGGGWWEAHQLYRGYGAWWNLPDAEAVP